MREPWSCGASCRQLGCRPSPSILGRLRWLLGLMAKNPAGFGPQHPKPQACAAPTGEEQTPGSWLWDRVDISSYRTSQSSGCLGYAYPSAHPLQSPSGRGCHGGVVRCFVVFCYRILVLEERTHCVRRQRLEAGGAGGSASSPLLPGLVAEARESSRRSVCLSQTLLPLRGIFQKVTILPDALVLCLAFEVPRTQSLLFLPTPLCSPDPEGLPQAK